MPPHGSACRSPQIDNALNNAFAQRQVSTIYAEAQPYKVVMEAAPGLQTDPSMLTQSSSVRPAAPRFRSPRSRISSTAARR